MARSPCMEQGDVGLRNVTYSMFVELGRAPAASDVADRLGLDLSDVLAGWRRLHDAHALVLDHHTDEIRMANPFSAVPTAYRVQAGGRSWFANCAWDAVGICAALHVDGMIETSCPDCGEAISLARHRRTARRRDAALPLPRAGLAMVGRHRLHLKHDEPLPVGRAHRQMVRWAHARRDDQRRPTLRPGPRVVGRPPRSGVAATHPRTESSDPRRCRSDRRVLASAHSGVTSPGRPPTVW